MIKTLQQAKRFLTILFGFTLLALGIIMLALPGPGLLTIVLGLGILAAEYVWARRLLDRLKHHSDRLRSSIFQRDTTATTPAPSDAPAPSAATAPPAPTSPAAPSAPARPVTTVKLETTLHVQPLPAPTNRT
jgi:Putative transmembrane protein (PGPGW)